MSFPNVIEWKHRPDWIAIVEAIRCPFCGAEGRCFEEVESLMSQDGYHQQRIYKAIEEYKHAQQQEEGEFQWGQRSAGEGDYAAGADGLHEHAVPEDKGGVGPVVRKKCEHAMSLGVEALIDILSDKKTCNKDRISAARLAAQLDGRFLKGDDGEEGRGHTDSIAQELVTALKRQAELVN